MIPLGKILIVSGILLVVVGVIVSFSPKFPWLGRLPGDIFIQRGNFTFSFPLATCLVLSLLLAVFINLFFRQ